METICIEERAFYKLLEQVYEHLAQKYEVKGFKWIPGEQAMELLNISSKTTLQTLRDTGKIRFSQPQKRIILYDRDSISEYLERHAKNTF